MTSFSKKAAFALLMVLPAGFAAAQAALDEVVATVNDSEITLGEVLEYKTQLPPTFLQGTPDEQLQQIVDQLAAQHLLADEAVEGPLLDLQINNVIRTTKANAALQAYVDENMTDEYLQQVYQDEVASQPDVTEWHAKHILVPTEEEAQAALDRINGGESFDDVAKEVSKDGSAAQGGDLGWFGPGRMVPEFEKAVSELEVGAVSEPVQSQFGYHVIMLEETRVAEKPKFEDIEPQLREYAQSLSVEKRVNELKEGATITISEGLEPEVLDQELPKE